MLLISAGKMSKGCAVANVVGRNLTICCIINDKACCIGGNVLISKISLKNWRNFQMVDDIELSNRVFVVGANASGKSNFLDVFRFLHDIVKSGGGLEEAIRIRGGMSKLRCLSARQKTDIEIKITLSELSIPNKDKWVYELGIRHSKSDGRPRLTFEKIYKDGVEILSRPNEEDKMDPEQLTQTYVQQKFTNTAYRELVDFFLGISYLHLVPQLVKHPVAFNGPNMPEDPYGRDFLERIAQAPKGIRTSYLKKIEKALSAAVPHLRELKYSPDNRGIPHLEAKYEHWRSYGARQREDQFSDGTLRLIGLLWSILEGKSLLLLEEPEISLNAAIVRRIPALIYRLQTGISRQIFLSTHSSDILQDPGINAHEILLLTPGEGGTDVSNTSTRKDIRQLLEKGLLPSDVVLPRTQPPNIEQMELFDWK